MRMRHLAAMLSLLGVVLALTGCGVSATLDPVATAASKTQDAGGVKVTMAIDVADAGSQDAFTITAHGAVERDKGELTVDASKALAALGAPAGAGGEVRLL